MTVNLTVQSPAELIRRHIQVIIRLQTEPELRCRVEVARKPQRRLRGHPALAYRVWVAGSEYEYAQYIFRVLEVDGALRWADTASQSNMLMLATRFSRDVHEELYESDKIYSCPLVVGGLTGESEPACLRLTEVLWIRTH